MNPGGDERASVDPRGGAPRSTSPDRLAGETQPERTYLAWQRTGFAFVGFGVLLLHSAGDNGGHAAGWLASAFALSAGAVAWRTGSKRYHEAPTDPTDRGVSSVRSLQFIVLVTVGSGLAALAFVMT